jgi:hypothetical protein
MKAFVFTLGIAVACKSPAPPVEGDKKEPLEEELVPAKPPALPNLGCPVGDGVHVAVHEFLVREMAAATEVDSRAEVAERIQKEDEAAGQADIKPMRASLVESELSHVLTTLCAGTPGCTAAAVYDRSGLAVALSSLGGVVPPLGFADDARWQRLSAPELTDGVRVPLECSEARAASLPCDAGHQLVVFPVYDEDSLLGLAACIVNPG